MKMNHTSCVAMYNHVQLTVIHACQRVTSFAALMPSSARTQMTKPQRVAEASAADPVDAQHLRARNTKSIACVKRQSNVEDDFFLSEQTVRPTKEAPRTTPVDIQMMICDIAPPRLETIPPRRRLASTRRDANDESATIDRKIQNLSLARAHAPGCPRCRGRPNDSVERIAEC